MTMVTGITLRRLTAFAICGKFVQAKRLQRDVVYYGFLAMATKRWHQVKTASCEDAGKYINLASVDKAFVSSYCTYDFDIMFFCWCIFLT